MLFRSFLHNHSILNALSGFGHARIAVRPGQVVYNLAVEKWDAARLKFFEIGAKLLKNPADM